MGTAIAMTNEGIYTQTAVAIDAEMQEVQAARMESVDIILILDLLFFHSIVQRISMHNLDLNRHIEFV